MTTKKVLKTVAEKMFGNIPFSLMKHIPQGFEFYLDIKKHQPSYYPKTIFDVGANTGQTVAKWNKFFPKSKYYCFEPVSSTMNTLKRNTANFNNIRYFQCALGSEKGEAEIILCEDSSLNSFVDVVKELSAKTEVVQINTLDEICQSELISNIDVLKIDTEGFDIEVLKGATSLLEANSITFIQVEAGMNPNNKLHVPFNEFVEFLSPYGYVLFGLYEQHLEWTGEKRLSFSNPVFIYEKYACSYTNR